MALPSLLIAVLLLMVAAAYAQIQIPRFTAGKANALLARVVLAVTGVALGCVSVAIYAPDPSRAVLIFLAGFGAVHIPAAFILFIKQARHSGRS